MRKLWVALMVGLLMTGAGMAQDAAADSPKKLKGPLAPVENMNEQLEQLRAQLDKIFVQMFSDLAQLKKDYRQLRAEVTTINEKLGITVNEQRFSPPTVKMADQGTPAKPQLPVRAKDDAPRVPALPETKPQPVVPDTPTPPVVEPKAKVDPKVRPKPAPEVKPEPKADPKPVKPTGPAPDVKPEPKVDPKGPVKQVEPEPVKKAGPKDAKPAVVPPPPRPVEKPAPRGSMVIQNFWNNKITVVVKDKNGMQKVTIEPEKLATVEIAAGEFTYEVVDIQSPLTRHVGNGERFNIRIRSGNN